MPMKGPQNAYPNIQLSFLRGAGDIGRDPTYFLPEVNKKSMRKGVCDNDTHFFLNVPSG